MSEHKKRAEVRARCEDPINFTCGKCKQVVPFKEGYECVNCDVDDDDAEEE